MTEPIVFGSLIAFPEKELPEMISSAYSTSQIPPSVPFMPKGLDSLDREPAVSNADSKKSCHTRVLHLINGEHFSGAERVQQGLGKCLPEYGVHASFVCLKPGKFPDMSGLDRDLVHSMAMRGRFDFGIVNRIAKLARDSQSDVLHAHTPRTAMIACRVSKQCGIPWVYHVHSPTARDSTRMCLNSINHWVERHSLGSADHIITVSKSLRREMISRGYSRHKVSCIANGVSIQDPIDPKERENCRTWTLGMVALIRPRKGIEVLLEALSLLGRDLDRVRLEVIGPFETREYESQVMDLVQRYGVSHAVRFHGFCKDVPAEMRKLDAMVLPSLFGEGMPMVVLEALACGVPVIATKVEGTPEVVRDGREGILAEPRDPYSLAESIRRFISSRIEWARMSEQAITRQRSCFSCLQMAERTARVYRKLCH